MPGFFQIITPQGAEPVRPTDEPPNMSLLHFAVDGHIESVPFFDTLPDDPKQPCVVYCCEDGKLTGLPLNEPATKLWKGVLKRAGVVGVNDYLVGSIIIVWGDPAFMEAL